MTNPLLNPIIMFGNIEDISEEESNLLKQLEFSPEREIGELTFSLSEFDANAEIGEFEIIYPNKSDIMDWIRKTFQLRLDSPGMYTYPLSCRVCVLYTSAPDDTGDRKCTLLLNCFIELAIISDTEIKCHITGMIYKNLKLISQKQLRGDK